MINKKTHTSEQINILVIHAHNTFNNGSFMLLLSYIFYSHKINNRLKYYVELQSDDDLERLRQNLPEDINIERILLKITSNTNHNFFRKLFHLRSKLYSHIRVFKKLNIKGIVILGGDDFSEYYKKWMVATDLIRIKNYCKYFPVFMAGQTIGPFNKNRKKLAEKAFKSAHIYHRDIDSLNYTNEISTPKTSLLSSDLAFLNLPVQEEESLILKKYNLQKDNYICISPSGFYNLLSNSKDEYISFWMSIISGLKQNSLTSGKTIVLLPHTTRPEDDRDVISSIKEKISKDLVSIDSELSPGQCRIILGNSYFSISNRLHPLISTLYMNKPCIAFSYSKKFHGVIGKSLKLPELIIDIDNNLLKELANKVDYITSNYQKITDALPTKIGEQQQLAMLQIEDINNKLNDESF